jgi:7,8-dihydropterin-6-yl-methyl-4-(beta-D-ribofuranosyl)aminobenzene 5'-phosphate synthase
MSLVLGRSVGLILRTPYSVQYSLSSAAHAEKFGASQQEHFRLPGRGPSVLRVKMTLRKIRSRSVIIQRTEETMTALIALAFFLGWAAPVSATEASQAGQDKAQITILYDAFGEDPAMQKDWGYAALVEYGGKRILFDTGNNPDFLEQNAKTKRIDLSKLDFVVMSHRHGDHMGGLSYLLRVNPKVRIYAPKEGFGVYGSDLPSTFYRKDPSLPPEQRYYDGAPPEVIRSGSAWPGANFELVDKNVEIAPDIHLIALVSDKPGTLELHELSLAINTPNGIVIVVGCSHPGIERIAAAAATINPRIHMIVGGLHLVTTSDADIDRIVAALGDTYKVEYIAPGHCTGEPAFAALRKAYGDRYLYAGLGTTIEFEPRSKKILGDAKPARSVRRMVEPTG